MSPALKLSTFVTRQVYSLIEFRGRVHRDVTWGEIGLKKLVLKSYITGKIYFWNLKECHQKRSIELVKRLHNNWNELAGWVHKSCFMPALYARASCPRFMPALHVRASCPRFMSALHVRAACVRAACPCRMSLPHVPAACPLLHVTGVLQKWAENNGLAKWTVKNIKLADKRLANVPNSDELTAKQLAGARLCSEKTFLQRRGFF